MGDMIPPSPIANRLSPGSPVPYSLFPVPYFGTYTYSRSRYLRVYASTIAARIAVVQGPMPSLGGLWASSDSRIALKRLARISAIRPLASHTPLAEAGPIV